MSTTAARGILTRLWPAVPRAFCLIRVASGCHVSEISVHRHTIPRRGAKKIGPRTIPVIRVAESPGGADPRRVNCNTSHVKKKLRCYFAANRVGQSREIYSNSVPLSPPHWPYPKRIRPPSWPRVAVASSIQNTKLFTWRT